MLPVVRHGLRSGTKNSLAVVKEKLEIQFKVILFALVKSTTWILNSLKIKKKNLFILEFFLYVNEVM